MNLPAMQETWVRSLSRAWRRKWQPTPVFLPRKSHGQRSLADYSPWDRKESDTTEWLTLSHYPCPCTDVYLLKTYICLLSISSSENIFNSWQLFSLMYPFRSGAELSHLHLNLAPHKVWFTKYTDWLLGTVSKDKTATHPPLKTITLSTGASDGGIVG